MPETESSPMWHALVDRVSVEMKLGRKAPYVFFDALDALGIEDKADRNRFSQRLAQEFAKRPRGSSKRRGPLFSKEQMDRMIRDARIHERRFGPPEEKKDDE